MRVTTHHVCKSNGRRSLSSMSSNTAASTPASKTEESSTSSGTSSHQEFSPDVSVDYASSMYVSPEYSTTSSTATSVSPASITPRATNTSKSATPSQDFAALNLDDNHQSSNQNEVKIAEPAEPADGMKHNQIVNLAKSQEANNTSSLDVSQSNSLPLSPFHVEFGREQAKIEEEVTYQPVYTELQPRSKQPPQPQPPQHHQQPPQHHQLQPPQHQAQPPQHQQPPPHHQPQPPQQHQLQLPPTHQPQPPEHHLQPFQCEVQSYQPQQQNHYTLGQALPSTHLQHQSQPPPQQPPSYLQQLIEPSMERQDHVAFPVYAPHDSINPSHRYMAQDHTNPGIQQEEGPLNLSGRQDPNYTVLHPRQVGEAHLNRRYANTSPNAQNESMIDQQHHLKPFEGCAECSPQHVSYNPLGLNMNRNNNSSVYPTAAEGNYLPHEIDDSLLSFDADFFYSLPWHEFVTDTDGLFSREQAVEMACQNLQSLCKPPQRIRTIKGKRKRPKETVTKPESIPQSKSVSQTVRSPLVTEDKVESETDSERTCAPTVVKSRRGRKKKAVVFSQPTPQCGVLRKRKGVKIEPGVPRPFECTICGLTFKNKGARKAHYIVHTAERPFICTICDSRFQRKGALKVHLDTHKIRKCSHCNKVFDSKHIFNSHECPGGPQRKKRGRPRKLAKPSDKKELEIGAQNHVGQIKSKEEFDENFSDVTPITDDEEEACNLGENSDSDSDDCKQDGLTSKEQESHSELEDFLIDVRKFEGNDDKEEDEKKDDDNTESDDDVKCNSNDKWKDRQCVKCCTKFISEKDYLAHQAYHKRKYQCKFCLKLFIAGGRVRKHAAKVHADSFDCWICMQTYVLGEDLREHMIRVHDLEVVQEPSKKTELKPRDKRYNCVYCGKSIARDRLLNHILKQHPEES